jgi:hypothetical protein
MDRIKEVELTIRKHNIKYLPTFHKFNALMVDVVYCFEKSHKKLREPLYRTVQQ